MPMVRLLPDLQRFKGYAMSHDDLCFCVRGDCVGHIHVGDRVEFAVITVFEFRVDPVSWAREYNTARYNKY